MIVIKITRSDIIFSFNEASDEIGYAKTMQHLMATENDRISN
jgi:hypothetical protein